MELVFICSPYKGDIKKNLENAKKYCEWVGYDSKVPFAPHLYFTQFLDEGSERWRGMWWGKYVLQYCKEIHIFCNELTEGMIEEIEEAKKIGLKMTFYNEKMEVITHANYLIHPEIGPGYRRLISEYFGDRFYIEGCGNCSKCSREDNTDHPEAGPDEKQPDSRSLWDRLIGFFR